MSVELLGFQYHPSIKFSVQGLKGAYYPVNGWGYKTIFGQILCFQFVFRYWRKE